VALTTLNMRAGIPNPVRVSLVYPADATPGHLLSVVPASQLAMVQNQQRQLEIARSTAAATAPAGIPIPPAIPDPTDVDGNPAARMMAPLVLQPPPPPPPVILSPRSAAGTTSTPLSPSLLDRYQQALEAQQQMMRGLMVR
jgi:hypothetical protein